MLSGLRSRFKSFRKGDEDARIERKARNAARSITKTASRDLLEWEEKNGYTVTKSQPTTSDSSSSTFIERARTISAAKRSPASSPSSTFPRRQQKQTSSDSPLAFPEQGSSPLIETPHEYPTGSQAQCDTHSAAPQIPPVEPSSSVQVRIEQPSPEERQRRITLQMEVEEKQRLLEEIQTIRQSIQNLKTASPKQHLAPLSTNDLTTSPKSSAATSSTQTPASSAQLRKNAPWLTNDRSARAQSLYVSTPTTDSPLRPEAERPGSRNRRTSIADIFAGEAPRSPTRPNQGSSSTGPPQVEFSQSGSLDVGNVTPPENEASAPNHHKRTTSAASRPRSQVRIAEPIPPVPPLPNQQASSATAQPTKRQSPSPSSAITPPDRRLSKSPAAVPARSTQRANKTRQIVDTPEEAQRRYSLALGRSRTPPNVNAKRRSMITGENNANRGSTGMSSSMTLAELQERHLAKLRQMQSPTSEKLLQDQAFSLAKADWEKRTRLERQEQQRKAKEREEVEAAQLRAAEHQKQERGSQRRSISSRPSLSIMSKDRRRTLSEDMLKSYQSGNDYQEDAVVCASPEEETAASPAPVMTTKRMNGAQKAREWRQTIGHMSEEERLRALQFPNAGSGHVQQQAYVPDEFGNVRTRAKSTLGLARPSISTALNSASPSVQSAQHQGSWGQGQMQGCALPAHYPSFAPPPMPSWNSYNGSLYAGFPSNIPSGGYSQATTPCAVGMSMSRSHSPSANRGYSPLVDSSAIMSASHSYFVPPTTNSHSPSPGHSPGQTPSISPPKHRRQLTATDVRRLREGAGPGRRPQSVVLNHEASRLSQRVG
ncbi:unnamed protein product [Sympodiomycopsis kandeliae]